MTDHNHQNWENHEPEELKMALENIRQQPVPIESLEKSLAAVERIPMTGSAWKRGFLNALLVGVPMYIVIGLLTSLITWKFGTPQLITFMVICLICSLVAFACSAVSSTWQNRGAGKVLIDCGPTPGRRVFLLQIPIMFLAAGYFLSYGWKTDNILIASGFAAFSLFWIFMARSRLQICEGGIRLHQGLVPWQRIQSYQWKEGDTPTLLLRINSRWSWYSHGAFPIPAKFRDAVGELLQQKVGQNASNDQRI